jgi:hypothetical protein
MNCSSCGQIVARQDLIELDANHPITYRCKCLKQTHLFLNYHILDKKFNCYRSYYCREVISDVLQFKTWETNKVPLYFICYPYINRYGNDNDMEYSQNYWDTYPYKLIPDTEEILKTYVWDLDDIYKISTKETNSENYKINNIIFNNNKYRFVNAWNCLIAKMIITSSTTEFDFDYVCTKETYWEKSLRAIQEIKANPTRLEELPLNTINGQNGPINLYRKYW